MKRVGAWQQGAGKETRRSADQDVPVASSKVLATSARRLPMQHVRIRVPWRDGGWASNVSCLVPPSFVEPNARRSVADFTACHFRTSKA